MTGPSEAVSHHRPVEFSSWIALGWAVKIESPIP